MPRQPIGERPLTNAERQARYRAARAAGVLVTRKKVKNLFVGSAIQSMWPRLQLSIELPAVPGQATIQPDHRISIASRSEHGNRRPSREDVSWPVGCVCRY